MVNLAVIMCGGKSSRFSRDKSLFNYKGRTMISYILEALEETGVKKVILQANKLNKMQVEEEAEKYLKNFIVFSNPPPRYREFIRVSGDSLERSFFLLGGNQPMKKDFLVKLENLHKEKNRWIVTLYPREVSEILPETKFVSLSYDKRVFEDSSGKFVLHPPFIITKDLLQNSQTQKSA